MTQMDPPYWKGPIQRGPVTFWWTQLYGFTLEILHNPDFDEDPFRYDTSPADPEQDIIELGGKPSLGEAQQAARDALIAYLENVLAEAKRLTCEAKPVATPGVRITIEENP